MYSQDVNQSLWGVLLRFRELEVNPMDPPVRGEMLVAACIVAAITTWAVFRRTLDERLLFALVLTTGLMLYPASLEHYGVLLVMPLLMAWACPQAVPGGRRVVGAMCVVVYVLVGIGYEVCSGPTRRCGPGWWRPP